MGKRLLAVLALAALVSLATVAAASAERAIVVKAGKVVIRVNGGVTPKALPKKHMAPIKLHASAKLHTSDGTHPPAARLIKIDFDKHGTIEGKGLATCKRGQLEARDTKSAKKACPKAIVGKGKATVEVQFAESAPFESTGPLIFFNGGVKHGTTTMYAHVYVSVPAPTAVVTTVQVKKIHKGRYGTRAIAKIPTIAGGSGSTVKFAFNIHRKFRRHRKKVSYLQARCANGRFFAHASLAFDDGGKAAGTLVRPCKPRG